MWTCFLHTVLLINLSGLIGFVIWRVACVEARVTNMRTARIFIGISLLVLLLKVLQILVFPLVSPERVLSTDGVRYYQEIRGIAKEPWAWNPFTGRGPNYKETPKMGMSYLYGVILFMHGVASIQSVLFLNVALAFLTCLMAFLIARKLSSQPGPAILALLFTAVYPETAYWTARVVRENLTLLLVPLIVYCSICVHEKWRWQHVAAIVAATILLILTRAQLGIVVLLIAGYYTIVSVLMRFRFRNVMLSVLVALAGFLLIGLVRSQVRAAGGYAMAKYMTLSPGFWVSRFDVFLETLPRLMTLIAREEHGAAGILVTPAFVAVSVLFILSLAGLFRIYRGHLFAAGMILFIAIGFTMGLAFVGLVNIRFRATIAPMVIPLVAVTACHYWYRLGLPRKVTWVRSA